MKKFLIVASVLTIVSVFGWFTVLAGHAQTKYLMVAAVTPKAN